MINSGMMSSLSDMWATPQDFFDKLNAEFGFQTDVCAMPENAKCFNFYTPEIDGLKQEWKGMCFMNPPYGRVISAWVQKAFESAKMGGGNRSRSASGENRHPILSRLYLWQSRDKISQRSLEIRRQQELSTVPIYGCNMEAAITWQ